jgi:geranylgeranyl diphosphate synthase type II
MQFDPEATRHRIDQALANALADVEAHAPPKLARAIHHAVFPGGARTRPMLCIAVAEANGGGERMLVDGVAAALELLHCASLVHDDLPCFDDASVRRGEPSVQRAFGESLAVLAGDALIVRAFDVVGRAAHAAPRRLPALIATLTRAAGAPHGLVAGQGWEAEESIPLERYHGAKTGALFVAAAVGGALAAGCDPEPWRAVGASLGEAYQVADDLLDAHATEESAGKPTGRDAALGRPSAVDSLGTAAALGRLRELVSRASSAVPSCEGAPMLRALVEEMAERLVPASLKQSAA